MVIRSGSTPECSMANILPVRAKPVWISSMISRMPLSSQILRRACRNSGGAMLKPPSPCTGSTMIAATRVASTSDLKSCSSAFRLSWTLTPR